VLGRKGTHFKGNKWVRKVDFGHRLVDSEEQCPERSSKQGLLECLLVGMNERVNHLSRKMKAVEA
jgi:hypothetical protein